MTARPPRALRASQRPTAALAVAVLLAILAVAVGPAGRVDAQASTITAGVAGTRVRVSDLAQQAVVGPGQDVLPGQGRETSQSGPGAAIGSRVAPQTAARIGDDVIATADDAFTHGYSYHPRIRARGVQDPVGHNFPYSYDDVILRSTPVRQADGSLLYRTSGGINGKDGFFEIAVNSDTGTIFHRTFVGG
ncbi:MAG: hypothetical protein ACRD0Q_06435 [Acidimicrobiales bacterium]